MPPTADDPVYRNALRESLVALGAWAVCACYTLTYCSFEAYGVEGELVKVIWGIPEWILVGILLPWALAIGFAWWYCFRCIQDDDLSSPPAADQPAMRADQPQEK